MGRERPFTLVLVIGEHHGRGLVPGAWRTPIDARVAALKELLDPKVNYVEMYCNGQKRETVTRDDANAETAISDPLSIPELVAVCQTTEADITAAFGTVATAMKRLSDVVCMGDSPLDLPTDGRRGGGVDWSDPATPLLELRRAVWATIIARSQIRKVMSVEAWKKLDEEMTHGEPPAVTIANVEGVLANFRAEAPAMLKAAVDEVFDFLRPRSGGWRETFKTNSEFEIGERVVLTGIVSRGYGRHWDINYHYQQHLIALENVFVMADGKVRSEFDPYHSNLTNAIKACPLSGPCRGETDLFEFRGFIKGTLHLRFKRPDLVARLNVIAGGNRLKPTTQEAA